MNTWRIPGRGKGFTLIEMMVVIAIIGILMALLLPAIAGVMKKARNERAAVVAYQVASACRDYMLEYGKWPNMTVNEERDIDAGLVKLLQGEHIITAPYQGNVKKIAFMEITPRLLNGSGSLVDPWDVPYKIKFDGDFDNFTVNPGGFGTNVNVGVAVWSAGQDKNFATWSDNIRNW